MTTPRVLAALRGPRMRISVGRLAVLTALVLLIAGVAAILFNDPAYELNTSANERFAAGAYREALDAYRDLQRRRPEVAEVSVNLGNALHQLEEHASSLPEYDRALGTTLPALRAVALYNRGNSLFRLDRLEAARASYVEALRLDPTDRDAKFNIEVIDRLLEQRRQQRQQQRPGPGQQQPPGQQPPQGDQQQPGQQQPGQQQPPGQQPPQGQPAPGQPGGPQQPGSPDANVPSVADALNQFRRNLTIEEALRLLEALEAEQRGVRGLVEGDPRRGERGGETRY